MIFRSSVNQQYFQRKKCLISYDKPRSQVAEQYRTIQTSLQFAGRRRNARVIMVTSSLPEEGKTTTASNLAIVFSQQNHRVLLIDADLRNPTFHYVFQRDNGVGLSSLLYHGGRLEEGVTQTEVFHMDLLPSGPLPPNPVELLSSERMDGILEEARNKYDYIIVDTPPVLPVADALILARKCDGVVLVITSGKTGISEALKAREVLSQNGARLLGTIMNRQKKKGRDEGYHYYSRKTAKGYSL